MSLNDFLHATATYLVEYFYANKAFNGQDSLGVSTGVRVFFTLEYAEKHFSKLTEDLNGMLESGDIKEFVIRLKGNKNGTSVVLDKNEKVAVPKVVRVLNQEST